jgi:flagellar M-ring protein FliF
VDEYLKKVFTQIGEFFQGLTPARKIAVWITSGLIVAGIAALFIWAGDKTYKPLMSNLSAEDSAGIIRILRERQIPFRVDTTGKNISVPPESMDQLRLELATLGLPQNSVVGYEVFDKNSLGTTSFVQKVNQKRALEGELMRTIGTITGVRRSRVHLAMPSKSTFVEDQKKSTASVVLDLEPGTQLNDKQIYGIGNLVARAVEGMEVADVVIVDSNGKTLSKNASDPLAAATATQLDFKQKVEQDLEKRIENMLSRVVGDGHVVARVSADLDFAQVNETQTIYDQDGSAIRSVQENVKTMEGSRPGPQGPAGAASNLPGEPQRGTAMVKSDTKTSDRVTNYEVPQTIRKTIKPGYSTRKLSVAVMVDGQRVKTPDPKNEGKVLSEVRPWSPEKLKEFEDIVAGAMGIDRKRGDMLEIKNMEFNREDFEEASRMIAENDRKAYIQNMILYAVIGLTIILFFMLVVRPFIKWITENTIDSVDTFLPQTIEELEKLQKNASLPGMEDTVPVLPEKIDPEKVEGEMIKEKIITLVDANPHKAALILRDWLHDQKKKEAAAIAAKNEEKDGGGPGGGKSRTA